MTIRDIAERVERKINRNNPEIRFMECLCTGDADAAMEFFPKRKMFLGECVVDAPKARYVGIENIRRFAEGFLNDFEAERACVFPLTQTVAGGRSATEMEVRFQCGNEERTVPMVAVADLRPDGKMDEMRLYFYYGFMKGCSAYRRIIFEAEHAEPAPYGLMTGCVRRYFELLHGSDSVEQRIEDIIAITPEYVTYGGYRPEWVEAAGQGHEILRHHYRGICTDAPANFIVRGEAITDDGVICVVEWTLLTTEAGYKVGHVSQSGIAMYERDQKTGELVSIRICDNVGMEDEIDPEELPKQEREKVLAYRASRM